jgi:hypothetical protein
MGLHGMLQGEIYLFTFTVPEIHKARESIQKFGGINEEKETRHAATKHFTRDFQGPLVYYI